jgi:hypothetical protein
MITEKHVNDAADILALKSAARVLQRRSKKPNGFWLKVAVKVLNGAVHSIEEGKI